MLSRLSGFVAAYRFVPEFSSLSALPRVRGFATSSKLCPFSCFVSQTHNRSNVKLQAASFSLAPMGQMSQQEKVTSLVANVLLKQGPTFEERRKIFESFLSLELSEKLEFYSACAKYEFLTLYEAISIFQPLGFVDSRGEPLPEIQKVILAEIKSLLIEYGFRSSHDQEELPRADSVEIQFLFSHVLKRKL